MSTTQFVPHLSELRVRPSDLPHCSRVRLPGGVARPRVPGVVPRPHLDVLVRGAGGQVGAVPVEGHVVDEVAVLGGHDLRGVHLGRVGRTGGSRAGRPQGQDGGTTGPQATG